jgi:protocatechuate 3,4-dioxygenase beta subunit
MLRSVIALILSTSVLPAAAIHGRVVEAKSGDPVKKAVVIIRHAQETGLGAMTDASGEFQFEGVEPGAYTITAEHSGFIIDPESRQSVVNVSSENKAEITVKLLRTAAISGRVFNEDGDPVTGANVQIVPVNQKKNSGPESSAVTNDRGEYRAFNVQPGKYRIAVSYVPRFEQMRVKMQSSKSSREARAADTSAVTWYPAALDPRLGQVVNVEGGSDLGGFDVQILRARAVTVKGTVTAANGASPAFVAVSLSPVRQTGSFRSLSDVIQNGSGSFEIVHVLPGRYIVHANALLGNQDLSAHRAIEVGNTDVEGIQLTLAPPQTITGVFVLPEGRKMPSALMVSLATRDSDSNRDGAMTQVDPDGSFEIRGVATGDYDITAGNVEGDDLYVSAIRDGDQDAFSGIHVGGQQVGPLKIILKGNGGTAQVTVKDTAGKPQPTCHVKVVPDPPRRMQRASYSDCTTDATGTCTMIGIAPGAYHVFTFPPDQGIDFRNADEIANIDDSGTPFTIEEGEKRQLDVKLITDDKPI